ncbi:MAG: hypothetical protein LCH41_05055 [Armatimonadetes bacterium]|nr:hypothetical protein [Armatimonadota bacterium]
MRSSTYPKNPLKTAGIVLVMAALLAAGLWAITSRGGLKEAQQKAKAAGIPTTSAELNPKPGAPAEENAADLLLSYDLEIVSNQSWAKASPAEKERMMAPAVTKLDALRAVLDKTYLDFNRDWTQHMESLFHEGPVIKSLIKDLTERAKLHAQQGRTSEALKDLEVAQHIAHLVHDDVGIIGHLVAVAVHRIKDVAVMDVATTLRSKGQSVEGLQRLLDREKFPSLARAVKTEAYLISFTESLRPPLGGGLGFEDFRRLYLLEAIKDLESLNKNPDDVLKAAKEIDARFARVTGGLNLSPGNLLYSNSRTSFDDLARASLRSVASRQVAGAYLDILAFAAQKGRFPNDLTELGGDRTDPFSGNPLGYSRFEGGFKVWSVDGDGLDDKGLSRQELRKQGAPPDSKRGDIVASWRPK